MGHVRDLPKRKLGLDVAQGYSPSYEVVAGQEGDRSATSSARPSRADMVYLATDPDREGEAIAWHLQQALDLPDERVRRVTFHEITERAVKDAFAHVGPINMDMVNAQQARRFLDRFVGYQLSPLLWKKVARNLSAGRVQSVAVRLIADRENGDPGVRHRGVLEDHRDREPGRLDGRDRPVRGRSGRVRGQPSSRPRTRRTPGRSATFWPRPRTSSRRSMRPRSSTGPMLRSRPARSSNRPRSACGSRASGR